MHVEERPAPPGLEGVVSRLWFLDMPRNERFEKILPMPSVHVIINLSAPYAIWNRAGQPTPVSDAFVSGLQAEYLLIESPPQIRHVGAELTPAGLHALAPTEYHRLASEYGPQAAHFVPLEQIPRAAHARS